MANFQPQRIDISTINGGQRYGYEGISPEAINAPIEASAYAQELSEAAKTLATTALDRINDAQAGSISLSAYPIGSIYMSVNTTSPAQLFGGTWEKLTSRFLLPADDTNFLLGQKGGNANITLRAAMGNYNNSVDVLGWKIASSIGQSFNYGGKFSSTAGDIPASSVNNSIPVVDVNQNTDQISIIPPYLSVYMWKRIA